MKNWEREEKNARAHTQKRKIVANGSGKQHKIYVWQTTFHISIMFLIFLFYCFGWGEKKNGEMLLSNEHLAVAFYFICCSSFEQNNFWEGNRCYKPIYSLHSPRTTLYYIQLLQSEQKLRKLWVHLPVCHAHLIQVYIKAHHNSSLLRTQIHNSGELQKSAIHFLGKKVSFEMLCMR